MPSEYLTAKELAARWRMSEGTLRNWRWKRIGPPFIRPARGKVLYRLKDVQAWERQHTERPRS